MSVIGLTLGEFFKLGEAERVFCKNLLGPLARIAFDHSVTLFVASCNNAIRLTSELISLQITTSRSFDTE